MAQAPVSREHMQQALDAFTEHGNAQGAADTLGLHRATFTNRLQRAQRSGLKPSRGVTPHVQTEIKLARAEIKRLTAELSHAQREELNATKVKREIIKLIEAEAAPPAWTLTAAKHGTSPGVPTLFCSDWHWGETVDPRQIGGVNEYSLALAHRRVRTLVATATHLLGIVSPRMDYPGIVLALGGDMTSGDIHEELQATNEMEIMPTLVDLFGVLIWTVSTLAERFKHVFVPCVTGNHGRDTKKIRAKGRNFTSFDWLLYQMLAKHFESDKRVSFLIPDGPDAHYRIFGHRYLLTHGDQFRGGDGIIGVLGPITRGDYKKRARASQIAADYDTMLMGHFHQLLQLRRFIVNGSLVGYNEYANSLNLPFEEPTQALWLTHPQHGITFSMPVYVDRMAKRVASPWVSVAA